MPKMVDNNDQKNSSSDASKSNMFGHDGNPFTIGGGVLGDDYGDQAAQEQPDEQNEEGLEEKYNDAKDLHKKLKGEKPDENAETEEGTGETEKSDNQPGEAKETAESTEPNTGEGPTKSPTEGLGEAGTEATGEIGAGGEAAGLGAAEAGTETGLAGTAGAGAEAGALAGNAAGTAGGAAAGNAAGGLGAGATTMAGAAGNATVDAGMAALATGTGTVGAEGAALAAGAASSGATAGIGLAVGAALALIIAMKDKLIKGLKTGGKAAIGFIIALTLMASASIAQPGIGAINGSNGKSNQVAALKDDGAAKDLINQTKQPAGNGAIKYKKLNFSERDTAFLNNIIAKGYDPVKNSRADQRVLIALKYLSDRHNYIKVSNIVSVYEDMPIDKENSSKPQVMANISAHVSGQAADIREIDFYYTGLDVQTWANGQCGPPEVSDKVDIVWLNDKKEELLRKKCKGSMLTLPMYVGGPVFTSSTSPTPGSTSAGGMIATKAVPIQIAWQDDPPKLSGNSKGTTRGYAQSNIEQSLRLPTGSLDKSSGNSTTVQTGFAEIAQQTGINSEYVTGNDANQLFTNIGGGYLEQINGLPLGSMTGGTVIDLTQDMGQKTLDDIFNLPSSSWQGNDLLSLTSSIGKRTMEKEIGLINDTLNNLNTAKAELEKANLTDTDIEEVATNLNFSKDYLTQFVQEAKNGQINDDIMMTFGARRLERTLGLQDGELDKYIQFVKTNKDPSTPTTPIGDLTTLINFDEINLMTSGGNEINKEKVQEIMTNLGNGNSINDNVLNLGASGLDNIFLFESGTTSSFILNGQGDPFGQLALIDDNTLRESGKAIFNNNFQSYKKTLGEKVLIDGLAKTPKALNVAINKQDRELLLSDPKIAAGNIGKKVLQNNTGCSSCSFKDVISQPKVAQQIDDSLNLSKGTVAKILGGESAAGQMTKLGSITGGGGLGALVGDDKQVMDKVKRPEARRKVHLAIEELLDITSALKNLNLKIIQLITFSQERDVDPFESKLEKLYGKSKKNGGTRAANYGLFSMPESHPNIHIGY